MFTTHSRASWLMFLTRRIKVAAALSAVARSRFQFTRFAASFKSPCPPVTPDAKRQAKPVPGRPPSLSRPRKRVKVRDPTQLVV